MDTEVFSDRQEKQCSDCQRRAVEIDVQSVDMVGRTKGYTRDRPQKNDLSIEIWSNRSEHLVSTKKQKRQEPL